VKKGSLVFVKSWNSRPSPVVEDSAGVDENIAVIKNLRVIFQVGDLDIVSTLLMIPVCSRNLMLRLDEIKKLVLAGK
jgi:hypothetical protein